MFADDTLDSSYARSVFSNSNLTYKDARDYLPKLIEILKINLESYPFTTNCLDMTLDDQIDYGGEESIFLFVNGPYFSKRECISFNPDGFIGFCGWADSKNNKPIINSFIEWCNYVKNDKDKVVETEIKPCPNCDCKDIHDYYIYMECSKCLMTGPKMNGGKNDAHCDHIDHENAIKAWNNLPRKK